ncbi:hypothetical protein [Flavobacterium sp. '19STA2R22 D10 B1']|uniref:hypothetical protein n=1 Tax=Flavobacterium aerium TaxID=3037261 RepID=UPI00278C1FE9|nr:hypothetical protein [Flavobacterium sp. '19STA2R22 D10 B1']
MKKEINYYLKFFLPVILLLLCCCKRQNFYHGYVYDQETKKPLMNVLVKESFVTNPQSATTDVKGYFKIENNTNSITDLVFSIPRYRQDTIPSVWSQHGERLEYTFLNPKPDTIFLAPIME